MLKNRTKSRRLIEKLGLKIQNQAGAALANMLILLFIVVTLSTVVATAVTFTARTTNDANIDLRADSAAQAGMDHAYVALYQAVLAGTQNSLSTINNSNPDYQISFTNAGNGVINVVATGTYSGKTSTLTASVAYEAIRDGGGNASGGSDLELYSGANITFNGGNIVRQSGVTTPIINLDQGNLTCQGSGITFNGNILLWNGNLNFAHSGCSGVGDVYVNGDANFTMSCPGITGNLYVTGNVTFSQACPIKGKLYVGGNLTITQWNLTFSDDVYINGNITTQGGARFQGNVYTNGVFRANGNSVTVSGNLISSSKANNFYFGASKYNKYVTATNVHIGGTVESNTGEPNLSGGTFLQNQNISTFTEANNLISVFPGKPHHWYSYIKPTSIDGYTWRTESCSLFNGNSASGWNLLGSLTTPTVFDLGNCNVVGSWRSTNVTVSDDVIIFGSAFQLEAMTFVAASGKTPKIHFIVPDASEAAGAQCVSSTTTSNLQGVKMGSSSYKGISGLIYTPCAVNHRWNGGWWRGVIYANTFLLDTQATLEIYPMTLPGAKDLEGTGGSNSNDGEGEITEVNLSFLSKHPG
ncbi:MAG: hypothetical protein KF916_00175 [Microbacteriaceae bacterium]|nr:hypothetical protein [Microbacteriaceae bacterium]